MKTIVILLIPLLAVVFLVIALAQTVAHSVRFKKHRDKLKALLGLAGLFTALHAPGQATNLLSLTYVNGTNNGNVFYASNIFVPRQKFIVQSLGITNANPGGSYTTNGITNSITVHFQLSVDGGNSNWVTLATWTPDGTNSLVANIDDEFARIALPMRAQVITTNALGVSVFKQ